jgi:hypothetical protein
VPFSNYLSQALLDSFLQKVAYTPPASLYIGLSTTLPSQAPGSGPSGSYWNVSEVTGAGYAPDAVTSNTTDWVPFSEPANGYQLENGIVVAFPISTGAWSGGNPIGYWFCKDNTGLLAPGTTNLMFFGSLAPNESVTTSGVNLEFPLGQLTTILD